MKYRPESDWDDFIENSTDLGLLPLTQTSWVDKFTTPASAPENT